MGRLFAVVVSVITLVSAAIFAVHVWWLPPDISTHGSWIDRQLNETMVTAGILFVAAQLALAGFVWRSGVRAGAPARPIKTFPGGVTPMVVIATVLVGIEILALTLVGSKVWADVYQTPAAPGAMQVEVLAEQFAFYFRYAGPDGKFGATHADLMSDATQNFFGLDPANDTTARDDIVVGSLVIPVDQPIELRLHAKDVGHSFYVPELRIQQDFVPGMVISWLMRFHLGWADTPVPGLGKIARTGAAGGVSTPECYLALMTMHGTIMVFFVLTTAPFAGFGNFLLPLHVGAEDMAFPRINMMSFWVTLLAFLVLLAAFFVSDGPPLSGWTAYAPLSAVGKDAGPGQGWGHTLGDFHLDLLYRAAAWRAQLHRDHARSTNQRHVARAPPVRDLGLVHHRGDRADCLRRADAGMY